MRISGLVALLVLTGGAGGCASIIEGTSQDIVVNTNPSGAKCVLNRKGEEIGTVLQTPGTVTVKKTSDDIVVVCDKDGFQQASKVNKADMAGATAGNILLGGVIGVVVDSATGAAVKYDSPIAVDLVPLPASPPPAAQAEPAQPLTN